MQRNLFKENLQPPESNIQEVLYKMIHAGHVSIKDFPHLSGFRTRISEISLKHEIIIYSKEETDTNKFGRKFRYVVHYLPNSEYEKAVLVYKKMIKEENS